MVNPAAEPGTSGIPSSTYRVQLSKDTTFDDAAALVPYLDALGVGALYASPMLESGAGSNHGYDVLDPVRVGFVTSWPEAEREGTFLDTSRPGNSNAGHTYGTELPAASKRALLEYLKTL